MEAWEKPVGNLGVNAVNLRLRRGLTNLTLALAATVALHEFGASWGLKLLLFIPLFGAASGFMQAKYKT